jgi:hypothetical protein
MNYLRDAWNEGSSPYSQQLATGPYPEPTESALHPSLSSWDPFWSHLPIYALVFRVVSFIRAFPPKPCTIFSPLPCVLSPGEKRGQGVTLTTHPHPVPRWRMSRSYTSSSWRLYNIATQLSFIYRKSRNTKAELNLKFHNYAVSNTYEYFKAV